MSLKMLYECPGAYIHTLLSGNMLHCLTLCLCVVMDSEDEYVDSEQDYWESEHDGLDSDYDDWASETSKGGKQTASKKGELMLHHDCNKFTNNST